MSANQPAQQGPYVVNPDPLDGETLLVDALFGAAVPLERRPPRAVGREVRTKPDRNKVICICLHAEDIERLEALVVELKRRGHHDANKSQVIREALAQLDLDDVAKGPSW